MKKIVVNIRMDTRLKRALEELAQRRQESLSNFIRRTLVEKLEKHGVDWQENSDEEN